MSEIRKLIRLAKITKPAADTSAEEYTQQVEYLGKVANTSMIFPYGHLANVPADSLSIMLSALGNPENRNSIAWDNKARPKLADGEVAVYHPQTDAFMIWRSNGDLDIQVGNNGTSQVNITASTVNLTADTTNVSGDLNVTGDLDVSGATSLTTNVTSNGIDIGNLHTHIGSPTAPAGPVSPTGIVL